MAAVVAGSGLPPLAPDSPSSPLSPALGTPKNPRVALKSLQSIRNLRRQQSLKVHSPRNIASGGSDGAPSEDSASVTADGKDLQADEEENGLTSAAQNVPSYKRSLSIQTPMMAASGRSFSVSAPSTGNHVARGISPRGSLALGPDGKVIAVRLPHRSPVVDSPSSVYAQTSFPQSTMKAELSMTAPEVELQMPPSGVSDISALTVLRQPIVETRQTLTPPASVNSKEEKGFIDSMVGMFSFWKDDPEKEKVAVSNKAKDSVSDKPQVTVQEQVQDKLQVALPGKIHVVVPDKLQVNHNAPDKLQMGVQDKSMFDVRHRDVIAVQHSGEFVLPDWDKLNMARREQAMEDEEKARQRELSRELMVMKLMDDVQKLQDENKLLQSEKFNLLSQLNLSNQRLVEEKKALVAERTDLQGELLAARSSMDVRQRELHTACQVKNEVQGELLAVRGALDMKQRELDTAFQVKQELQSELLTMKMSVQQRAVELETWKNNHSSLERRLAGLERQTEKDKQEQATLETRSRLATTEIETLQAQVSKLHDQLAVSRGETDRTKEYERTFEALISHFTKMNSAKGEMSAGWATMSNVDKIKDIVKQLTTLNMTTKEQAGTIQRLEERLKMEVVARNKALSELETASSDQRQREKELRHVARLFSAIDVVKRRYGRSDKERDRSDRGDRHREANGERDRERYNDKETNREKDRAREKYKERDRDTPRNRVDVGERTSEVGRATERGSKTPSEAEEPLSPFRLMEWFRHHQGEEEDAEAEAEAAQEEHLRRQAAIKQQRERDYHNDDPLLQTEHHVRSGSVTPRQHSDITTARRGDRP
eukprot:GILK01011006.1.p1 GENE.GILK01011006.1~~GILK01011006.1.p1  ORF type:complete len:826 (-),score=149.18 GILK01011006.1:286-2763(-)